MLVDSEGFQYKYVPKDAIINEDNLSHGQRKSVKGSRKGETSGYIYLKKPQNDNSST